MTTNQKPTFTFRSGITVELERVSPMIAIPIQRANRPPRPPMQEVETGPGQTRLVENPHDPDYREQLAIYNENVNMMISDAMLLLGVSDSAPIDHAAVDRARRIMSQLGTPIPEREDPKLTWLKYVVMTDERDLEDLIRALKAYGQVTEEAVAASEESFPS